jgi:hypothetical protein
MALGIHGLHEPARQVSAYIMTLRKHRVKVWLLWFLKNMIACGSSKDAPLL